MKKDPQVSMTEWKILRNGSLEEKLESVARAISNSASTIFGEDCGLTVLATFPAYVVVSSSNGKAARVYYECDESGAVVVRKSEPIVVSTYRKECASSFVHTRISMAVSSFLAGDKDYAKTILSEAALVAPPDLVDAEKEQLWDFIRSIQAETLWRRAISESAADLSESTLSASEGAPEKRFENLYTEGLTKEELEAHRSVVLEGLEYIAKSYSSISKTVELNLETLNTSIGEDPATPLITVKNVAESLNASVKETLSKIEESTKNLRAVDTLAIVYDTLAEELQAYHIASAFVDEKTKSLSKANSA